MSENEGEFLTVAEAARRLRIGERRAYRLSDKLSDTDRQSSDGQQKRVRLSALAALCGASNGVGQVSDDGPKVSDDRQTGVRQASDTASERIADLLDQLERERDAHEHEREMHKRTQDALYLALESLRGEQERTKLLESQTARLIGALPSPMPSADPGRDTPQEALQGPYAGDSAPDGDSAHPGQPETTQETEPEGQKEKPRRWWQRWKREKE